MKFIEFSPKFGFDLKYFIYEDPMFVICLLWGKFYIHAPFFVNMEGKCDATYGLSYHDRAIWWNWDQKFWNIWMPWHFQLISHDVENADGNMVPYDSDGKDGRKITQHRYTYQLSSGEIQQRIAKIYKETYVWRWNWFKWLPLSWITETRTEIDIEFDYEVGEKSGSWKGGVLGCSYEMLDWENPEATLRRMEYETVFDKGRMFS